MTRNTFWKMMLHDSRVITSTLTIFQASRWGVNDFHESRVEKNGSNVLGKKKNNAFKSFLNWKYFFLSFVFLNLTCHFEKKFS